MKAKIDIQMDNAAFDDAPASELARILREIAIAVELGTYPERFDIRDINGNRVGQFTISKR